MEVESDSGQISLRENERGKFRIDWHSTSEGMLN